MAVPANTRLTFGGVQIREDLSDIIYISVLWTRRL